MATTVHRLIIIGAVAMAFGLSNAIWQVAQYVTLQPQHVSIIDCKVKLFSASGGSDLPSIPRPMIEATVEYQKDNEVRIATILDDKPPGFRCGVADVDVFLSQLSPASARFTPDDIGHRLIAGTFIFMVGLVAYRYARGRTQ